MIAVIIIITIFWAVSSFKMVAGLKRADCTLTKFYAMMENGVNDVYHGKFLGIFGLKQLLTSTKQDLLKSRENTVNTGGSFENKIA